ncbi:Hypothetical protein, putative [Bodo saltans]|uniref:Uncharacterized protein n=1 Tax=Bodo saltans TaxID=75058 RepID=A0A0S4J028_BODSA|nr:Hypothetical protein, putative [Bodo saltans]|eukprot:CUG69390.1 Hypothetical protein, putative [Bodo saltans]
MVSFFLFIVPHWICYKNCLSQFMIFFRFARGVLGIMCVCIFFIFIFCVCVCFPFYFVAFNHPNKCLVYNVVNARPPTPTPFFFVLSSLTTLPDGTGPVNQCVVSLTLSHAIFFRCCAITPPIKEDVLFLRKSFRRERQLFFCPLPPFVGVAFNGNVEEGFINHNV